MYDENPFNLYGNFVYNRYMFLLGQQDLLGWRDDWDDEIQF